MNNYEIVYIIHPALQEGRLSDIKSKIHEKITSFKGKVLYDDNWGKKKLAYAIDKQKYGTYLFCQFLLEGKDVQAINTDCELNSNILRHLISRIDSSQILDEKNKIWAIDQALAFNPYTRLRTVMFEFNKMNISENIRSQITHFIKDLENQKEIYIKLSKLISEEEVESLIERLKSIHRKKVIPELDPYLNVPYPLI